MHLLRRTGDKTQICPEFTGRPRQRLQLREIERSRCDVLFQPLQPDAAASRMINRAAENISFVRPLAPQLKSNQYAH